MEERSDIFTEGLADKAKKTGTKKQHNKRYTERQPDNQGNKRTDTGTDDMG